MLYLIVAPDYNTLLMSRFLAGLPHGAFLELEQLLQ